MGFEELAALKQQLSKRAQADKPQRSQAERPARDSRGSQESLGAQGRVQGTKSSAAPGAQASKPRNASASPATRSGPADGATRNRHRHGEANKPGNGGYAGRRPAAPARAPSAEPVVSDADAQKVPATATRKPSEQAQRGPRPPRPEKRTQPPVEPVVITIGQLQKRFPLAFPKNPAPKSPLKLGISKDLIAQAETLALSEADLLEAIKVWCQGSRYWAAMTKGAARVNLEGQPEGIVTPEQAAHARSLAAASRRAKHGIVPKKKGEAAANATAQAVAPGADATAALSAVAPADAAVDDSVDDSADKSADASVAASADAHSVTVPAADAEAIASTEAHQEAASTASASNQADATEHTAASATASSETPTHSSISSH